MKDDSTRTEAVQARSFIVLDLEELEQFDLLSGRTDDAEVAATIGK